MSVPFDNVQARQRESLSEVLALQQRSRPSVPPKRVRFESWVEGPRSVAAVLDSGVQSYGLKVLYWREHKVGWFTVRVVYGVEGSPERVRAFRRAVAEWVDGNR